MDKLPPINFDAALDAIFAVEQARTIGDMGISTLAWIKRYALCSNHGNITDEVEVHDVQDNYVVCGPCHSEFGITRRCPVEAIGPVGE